MALQASDKAQDFRSRCTREPDVKGTPVTIIYGGPPEEGFKAAAEPVVQSIRFLP